MNDSYDPFYFLRWPSAFDFFGDPKLQSDEQSERAQLFTLVTKPKRAPHIFAPVRVTLADEAADGLERHARKCAICSLSRDTVITPSWAKAPRAYRAYRDADGCEFIEDIEPGCPGLAADVTEAKAS